MAEIGSRDSYRHPAGRNTTNMSAFSISTMAAAIGLWRLNADEKAGSASDWLGPVSERPEVHPPT